MRRSARDRMDEAAVYRSRTEAAQVPTVSLSHCEFDKQRKVLKLASEYFGMPTTFFVKSHHTGKVVKFTTVKHGDKLFDEDQWDGEQQVYRPEGNVPNVDHLVIYHAY